MFVILGWALDITLRMRHGNKVLYVMAVSWHSRARCALRRPKRPHLRPIMHCHPNGSPTQT